MHPEDTVNLFLDFAHPRFTPVKPACRGLAELLDARSGVPVVDQWAGEDIGGFVPTTGASMRVLRHSFKMGGERFGRKHIKFLRICCIPASKQDVVF